MSNPLPFRSEPNYLLENGLPFLIHSSTGLENYWRKVVVRVLKGTSVAVDFLMLSIRFAGLRLAQVRLSERADDGHVDGETTPETPVLDRHIAGPTTGFISFTKDP